MLAYAARAAALSLCLAAAAAPVSAAGVPESTDTIKFGLLDWTGNHLTNHIAGEILSRMGYNVEYAQLAQAAVWQGLADGSLQVDAEQWLVDQKKAFDELEGQGKVESLGNVGLVGREAWYYPAYVEAQCPGLPAWEALKKCANIFGVAETAPKGRLLDFPAEWTPQSPLWIDVFGLDLTAIPAGSEGALIAEMKSATQRKQPLLVMFYEPHWAVGEYGMKAVELPANDAACATDPAWGVNKDKTNDCYEAAPEIVKVAATGFAQKFPAAAKVLQQLTFTNEEQAPLIKKVDVDGQKVVDVAKEWVDNNSAKWQPWVDAATK